MMKYTEKYWNSSNRRVEVEHLDFPVPSPVEPQEKYLSMDEYLEFVCFNLEHTFTESHREKARQLREQSRVNTPFVLK